ncbi:P-loop containing nucleoside triphosphate hydrolase protein [Serendipita vermifera]|nr:P-loop containing nucleoside triphosphate hydrolase protein [Serendipita vermifera]
MTSFLTLLQYERDEESRRNEERQTELSSDELVAAGFRVLGLSAYPYIRSKQKFHDGFTFDFVPSAGEYLDNSLLTGGVQITIKRDLDPEPEEEYVGTVIFSSPGKLRVKMHNFMSKVSPKMKWRVDLGTTDITYARMKQALDGMRVDPTEMKSESAKDDQVRGTYLRDVLLHGWGSEGKVGRVPTLDYPSSPLISNTAIQDWAHRYAAEFPIKKAEDPDIPLNDSQIRAIAQMLRERMSLVQGPPGTGKTSTIVEALKLLKSHFKVKEPILVCTYTNAAVDHLVDGISSGGLKPLRVGNEGKIRDDLEKWSIQTQREMHPKWNSYVELTLKREDLIERLRKEKREQLKDIEAPHQGAHIRTLFKEMDHDILQTADIICTTCISAGSSTFDVMEFPIVFIDEASMSTEPACLIPLMHGSQHVALIGDHEQLPPVITSIEAQQGGLAQMCENTILDTQHRMHPDISAFSNSEFYGNELKDGANAKNLKPPTSRLSCSKLDWAGKLPPVLFIDHDNSEVWYGRSRANSGEIEIVGAIIEDLLLSNPELKGEDIGVISPYVSQVRTIKDMLRVNLDWEQSFNAILGERRAAEIKEIEVKTVDGFEGREKEIIIFSTVRNNSYGGIGFLADKRRMNVAFTRAKRALFVLGSMRTLSRGKVGLEGANQVAKMVIKGNGDEWKKFVQFVVARELFIEYGRPTEYRSPEEISAFEESAMTPLTQGENNKALVHVSSRSYS